MYSIRSGVIRWQMPDLPSDVNRNVYHIFQRFRDIHILKFVIFKT